jgi:hypothetical protein
MRQEMTLTQAIKLVRSRVSLVLVLAAALFGLAACTASEDVLPIPSWEGRVAKNTDAVEGAVALTFYNKYCYGGGRVNDLGMKAIALVVKQHDSLDIMAQMVKSNEDRKHLGDKTWCAVIRTDYHQFVE